MLKTAQPRETARQARRHRRRGLRRTIGSEGADRPALRGDGRSTVTTTICSSRCSIRWRPPGCRLRISPRRSGASQAPAQCQGHARRRDRRRRGAPPRASLRAARIPYDVSDRSRPARRHAYFGREDWAPYAPPGLKRIDDATYVGAASSSPSRRPRPSRTPVKRRSLLNFVVVGGGPTGVEMAGAIAELAARRSPRISG